MHNFFDHVSKKLAILRAEVRPRGESGEEGDIAPENDPMGTPVNENIAQEPKMPSTESADENPTNDIGTVTGEEAKDMLDKALSGIGEERIEVERQAKADEENEVDLHAKIDSILKKQSAVQADLQAIKKHSAKIPDAGKDKPEIDTAKDNKAVEKENNEDEKKENAKSEVNEENNKFDNFLSQVDHAKYFASPMRF